MMLKLPAHTTTTITTIAIAIALLTSLTACGGSGSGSTTSPNNSNITAPSAPTILSAATENSSTSISFSIPTSTGGAPITSYTASCIAAGVTKTGTSTASPVTVTGLIGGTNYSCSVQANNSAGASTASEALSVTPTGSSSGGNNGSSATFALTSVAGVTSGTLATTYTCDGSSLSPPLTWGNPPAGTISYAVVMSTIPATGNTKYNWLLYNIPSTTTSLVQNNTSVGTFGNSDDGGGLAYAPPCPQELDSKDYTFTIYALSDTPNLSGYTPTQVNGTVLLNAITPLTLASSSITLSVIRTQQE